MSSISKPLRITSWVLQIIAAFILGQTLFFKFTGAEETKALFEVLGAEPWGRYASGVMELIAVVLLLIPRTSVVGAMLALGVILGAIGAHLTKLGISIDPVALGNEALEPLAGPMLFVMAVVVLVCSVSVIVIRRNEIPFVGGRSA
ncbi:MAG: DoxX family protein [Phycisphaerales bacterium]|nr:DoxX family protein [Phycisphaerales bacterium]